MYLTYEYPVALVIYQRFVYQTFGDGPPKKIREIEALWDLYFVRSEDMFGANIEIYGFLWSEGLSSRKPIACPWKSMVGVDEFSLVGQKAYFHGWTVSFREFIF